MGIAFTPEQQRVIDVRDRDVLVSAAAGSGKTAVLVERIVNRISDRERPVDIDRLLVVTFTNAAAAEMRERIGAAVEARLSLEPDNEHLQRQTTLIHNAQITTIDSFCMFVIRNNFNDIGLDPGFRVADEGEIRLLGEEVMAELLEERFAEGREAFLHCVEYFSTGNRDNALEGHIMKLYRFAESCPWPEEWLEERKKDYDIHSVEQLDAAEWTGLCLTQLKRMAKDCIGRLEECLALCGQPDGPWMYAETLEREIEQLQGLAEVDVYHEGYAAFQALSSMRLPSKKDDAVSAEKRNMVKELRKEIRASLARLQELYFPCPAETAVKYMEGSLGAVCELTDLALAYGRRLAQRKREENIIDFGDMEHFALSILVEKTEDGYGPTKTALDYRAYFKEILIDEYQDSNLVQEYLLRSISGEDEGKENRFMVGDVKQSIYRFRLARPEIFMEKYDSYGPEEGKRQRIDLHRNFRSRTQIIDTVNYIFAQIMRRNPGGVEYDEAAFLRPGASYPEAGGTERDAMEDAGRGISPYRTELLLTEKPVEETKEEETKGARRQEERTEQTERAAGRRTEEEGTETAGAYGGENTAEEKKMSARQREAYVVAKRIRELAGTLPVTEKKTGVQRPCRYGDIVVLLRTNAGWDDVFRAVFKEEGIPSHAAVSTGYFAAGEIRTLLQLLRVLDNPEQDIPLFGVLSSFFGGFDDHEIAKLRAGDSTVEQNREKSLYVCLREAAERGEEKAAQFLSFLNTWRDKSVYLPIHELLRALLTQSGYLRHVLALPGGEQRRANVEMLLEKAASFERTSRYGLFHFIRYVEQLEKFDVDYGEANILDENADVVRIMSIHKSKGLEFPVCFVCGLSKRFNRQDVSGKLIADVDIGVGVDFVDPQARLQGRTLRKNIIAEKMREDGLGEELRVLYVALTRAKEKLIMTGTIDRTERLKAMLTQARLGEETPLFYSQIAGAGSYMELLLPALARHPAFDAWWGDTLPAGRPAALPKLPELEIRTVTMEDIIAHEIREQLAAEGERRRLELSNRMTDTDNELMTYMSKKFACGYEHANLADLYTKTTVSELKKAGQAEETDFSFSLYEEEEVIPYIPRFMRTEETLGGAGRGSAFHKVMELIDPGAVLSGEKSVREQLDGMLQAGRISEEYRNAVSDSLIKDFFATGLAKRMAAADERGLLYREQPFVLGLSAAELSDRFPPEETVLIQGIIDVYFEENGELVVADYKTDRVKGPEELVGKYEKQLDYYARALEQLTGKRVKEKVIYSFGLHMEIVL